ADAAGRDTAADGPRLGGAVDAVERILVTLPQIKRACAERVARSARHPEPALQLAHVRHQLGLAREHFLRRIPVRPLLLVVHIGGARPAEALAPDADPVANGLAAVLHEIKVMVLRVDDDGAGRLAASIRDRRAYEGGIDVGHTHA